MRIVLRGRHAAWGALLLLWVFFAAGLASAQTLDEIETLRSADAVVVRIRFNAAVRFMAQLPGGPASRYVLRFELIGADEALLRQNLEEFRRVQSQTGLPGLVLNYSPDPRDRTRQLRLDFERSVQLITRPGPNSRTIELLVRPVDRSQLKYGVLLESLPVGKRGEAKPIPAQLQGFDIVSAETAGAGEPRYEVVAGYFGSLEEAEAVRALAISRFPQARVFELGAAPARAAALPAVPAAPPLTVAVPSSAPAQAASAPAGGASAAAAAPSVPAPSGKTSLMADGAAQPEVERAAEELMRRAKAALVASRLDEALTHLNELLRLPPNSQSESAQELIGQVWERAGSPSRARSEYDLYMRLYPKGEASERIVERLRAIAKASPAVTSSAEDKGRTAPKPFTGSISQYYSGGKAKSQSLVNIATGIDQSTLSRTTESAIVTSVDLSGRVPVDSGSDGRFVVRGSGATNLVTGGHSKSQLSSAYFDYRRGSGGLAVRAGRQSPISGGLLGLFDGVSLALPISSGMKASIMGGVPANTLVSAPGEQLFAAVVEADGLIDRVGGSLYLMNQTSEGIVNRRSLGGEARYAGDRWSLNGLLDYETQFRMLNAWSLQGSWQAVEGTHVTVLADQRRAPSLQLTNALISSGAVSLKTLLQAKTMDQVRADALSTSAMARQFMVSVAQTVNKQWQASADLRYSAIGALPAVGDFGATQATGGQYTVSAQVVGTNLYSNRDINNISLSLMNTPFFRGAQLSYSNLTTLADDGALTLEPSLRFYTQKDKQEVTLTRIGPGVRSSWRASRRASLLAELLYEDSRSRGPTGNDHTKSAFFYVGYRYELF